jgi:hypothetical protein|tara:strand:- start:570 stop:743 length:174 start_codon:yes stop_codon:yes gene_type:complete
MIHRTQSTRAHENSKYQSYLHKKTRTSSNESNTQEEEDKEEALNSRIESEREGALES